MAAMELTGDRELERLLRELPGKVQRKVTRRAINKGATRIVKAVRANVKSESGLLKKSIGRKVKTAKDGTVMAVIGPRRDVQGEFKGKIRKPSRYAHLVEKGHLTTTGQHVPAQPFMRPGFDSSQGDATDTIGTAMAEGIIKEAGAS